MPLPGGDKLGPYTIISLIGAGGMGSVYKAHDTRLNRTVALKFVHVSDQESRARLLSEVRAAAALHHPSICTIFEVDAEHPFLVMEFVEGQTLKERIGDRPLPLEEALSIARQWPLEFRPLMKKTSSTATSSLPIFY